MLVSVIMPTYNCEKYIAQSIDSVIAQTITDWEIQIVDDGSTDNTVEIIKPYLKNYSRIHYYKLLHNVGPAVARTEAIKRATGKYIAFLDSDDIWTPRKLEIQIEFMEKTGFPFSCTAYELLYENGAKQNLALFPPDVIDYKKCIRLSNPMGNLTVMYNQELLGKFEVPNIKKRNDFALWLQILHKTKYCAGLSEVLGLYRVRENSVSSNKLKLTKYHWQLYRKIEKHNLLRSIYEMSCWLFVKGIGIGLNGRKI